MTFANEGFHSSPHCLILSTSPPSSSQPGVRLGFGAQPWSLDLWSPYYTPNHCTSIPKPHDPPTFDPTCICPISPANLASSTEQLKQIYPSPPPTDSDPKHTVPLPILSEDSPSHVAEPEPPLTSHPSNKDLPLSPPPSLPMVPHALPEATTPSPCCTLDRDACAHYDPHVKMDATDSDSHSSSSPEESPTSDLLTPLPPIWDLPLDDADARPASTLEVSTLLSRSLVPPLSRLSTSGVQAMEGDRVTLPFSSNAPIRGLDSKLRPSVVPPDGFASARFSIFHNFPSPNLDSVPPDGTLTRSHTSPRGKLFVDPSTLNFFLPDHGSPQILPQLTLFAQPLPLRRRISLPSLSVENSAAETRDALVSHWRGLGTSHPFCATSDMSHYTGIASINHKGTEPIVTSSLFQHFSTPEPAPPLSEIEEPSIFRPGLSAAAAAESTPSVTPDTGPMEVDDSDSFHFPSSPMHHTLSDLPDDDDDLGGSSIPLSPSRRSFADLPEDFPMNGPPTSPPQSSPLTGQPLLTFPGAEPDNSLITAENLPSPPRGSGLGLFLPIQAASSNQPEASEMHAIEPNLHFSPEATSRVNTREFEMLKSVRRRTWVSERKAKEDEVFHAKRAESLAGRLSVAPPVPSKLADFDERGGVSAGADETEGPPGEPTQLDESDEKTIRAWLLFTEARRAEARRVRKREKERGRELQALLRLKLGEDPDASEHAGGVKVKPGKTAIVSMPQLVARMIMKRRDTPRPFSPRKHGSPPTVGVDDINVEKREDVFMVRNTWFPHVSHAD
ncbi:hypothetical protein F5148DRAFT_1232186 [Russula earlei]|uniref:Uncharacterized protein n=1 Tax=Russula earlei TaxID=71964 RepID=A0ACC0TYE7_9AGAM|nr:hypothetical protein F5148DRAFT_1232186 [Russula earlei]